MTQPTQSAQAKPTVVGIGASAGGIQALQSFFDSLPEDTGAAFIVVMHLDPQSHSELATILASRTSMAVLQAIESQKLQSNHVYVAPPNRRLELTDGKLSAEPFEESNGKRSAIDLFFRSLARSADCMAVILTGAGSDGSVGVRAVKETGGIVLVQDPEEAEYTSMPRSAIATGVADFVLPVREIAECLVGLIKTKVEGTLGDDQFANEELLHRVLASLRVRTGHDFFKYKRSTVMRRIGRRMQITGKFDLESYHQYLRNDPDEPQALLSDLLITVTTFFRDKEVFEAVKARIIKQLVKDSTTEEEIRVWVPGCATGEEAYSIAMLLDEEETRQQIRTPVQVFGTDLDQTALNVAREGRYPTPVEADISEEYLQRYFQRDGNNYAVRQELRDKLLFASHNIAKDPPFSRLDLISCRNLLIYLDRELQHEVISAFHYALKPGKFLVLGGSENAEEPKGLFRCLDRHARIYQSTLKQGERPHMLPALLSGVSGHNFQSHFSTPVTPAATLNEAVLHREALERLAPPSIVVDYGHKVVHLSDNAGRFLRPAGGTFNGDVTDLVRPELRVELRSALHRAMQQHTQTLTTPIPVDIDGESRRVLVVVRPTSATASEPGRLIVMFVESERIEESYLDVEQYEEAGADVHRLMQELELTQALLRSTREESETANEELRAANEELQSMNEEYRSTSEELETSKEELQSINEELQTVNQELKLKLDSVSRGHNDLRNLIAATDFGTLFLDSNLRIKLFTNRVTELFSITSGDEGRPITDFAHQLEYDDLAQDARKLLSELSPIRREVRSRNGQLIDIRLRPYRTAEDRIEGIVITFIDITQRREMEGALETSDKKLQQVVRLIELSHDPIFVWELDGRAVEWNRGSEELYGYSREKVIGKNIQKKLRPSVPGSSFAQLKTQLTETGSWNGELYHRTRDGRTLVVESKMQLETFNDRQWVLESTHDITDRKRWEKRQRLLLGELSHRVKNILSVVQAVAHKSLRADGSLEENLERFDGRLSALAATHSLLTETNWEGADLQTLAYQQIEPYLGDGEDRIAIEGQHVVLPPVLTTPFGLVFHELATNAAKYGALSCADGKVLLSWTSHVRKRELWLRVTWTETGGPPSKRPAKAGLGTKLIDNVIPDSKVRRQYRRSGFACWIEVPLSQTNGDDELSDK